MCGLIRFITNSSQTENVTDWCKSFQEGDRGWFRRVHDYCNEVDCKDHPKKLDDLIGYGGVMTFAIVCGIGWILSGLVALAAHMKPDKFMGIIAGVLFTVIYFVFIGVFTAVWVSVKRVRDECPLYTSSCDSYKKRVRKSSIEFLVYSIIAFVIIFLAILCCFVGAVSIENDGEEKGESASAKKEAKEYQEVEIRKSSERAHVGTYNPVNKPEEEVALNKQNQSDQPLNKESEIVAIPSPEKEESKRYSGEEFKPKFKQLHKYLNDPYKMQTYADAKFDEVDTDQSGTISTSELKVFITDIMNSKGFPAPSNKKIDELMNYFDKDASGTLEKNEFEKMLYEVFIESREILVRRYAKKKAESWKPMKVPTNKNTSQLSALDKLLENPTDLYKRLDRILEDKGYNRESTMNTNELKEFADYASQEFNVPALSKSEINEVMDDIERPISEFNKVDQNLVIHLALNIGRELMN